MREYKIDLGNSSTGPIGAVAYVNARSKSDALEIFKRSTRHDNNDIGATDPETDTDLKIHVYFNHKKITLQDVEVVR